VTELAADLRTRLAQHGQEHLLRDVEGLEPAVRERFLGRLAEIDWGELGAPPEPPPLEDVAPPEVVPLADRERHPEVPERGEAAYRAGDVAVLMVAGGQGTRLGFPGPKGCFPLAPVTRKTIYQLQAEKVLSVSRRVGRDVPLLVLTSPATDEETRAFFADHRRFGLDVDQLRFFQQGTVPSAARDGRGLLATPGVLLENPDGHGGVFTALVASGELDRLLAERVRRLVYLQVDNVLAPVDDPFLVGLAEERDADVVTKVLEKAHPDERVGHLVRLGERDRIVEYTELSPEQTRARGADGHPVYRWGSPAMHCWSVAFLDRLRARGYRPPLHRSAKPLRAWADGETREVEGWKYERFVFDLVSEAERSIGLEIRREDEFAPVKNAAGDDSPATAVELMERQQRGWFAAAGEPLPLAPRAQLEISPLFAATRAQFRSRFS